MIPKIIHYCWLSGEPMPEMLQQCIASWKRFLPEYEFRLWKMGSFDYDSVAFSRCFTNKEDTAEYKRYRGDILKRPGQWKTKYCFFVRHTTTV